MFAGERRQADLEARLLVKPNNFETDPLNSSGEDQRASRDHLYSLAIKNPTIYTEWRTENRKLIVANTISLIYTFVLGILTKGEGTMGATDIRLTYPGSSERYYPCVPNAIAARMALEASGIIQKMCSDLMDNIMPPDHKDLALAMVKNIAKGELSTAGVDKGPLPGSA